MAEPIDMPFKLRTPVGPRNHVLDGGLRSPTGRGNFDGAKGRPIIKYRDTLWSSLQSLGCGLG